MYPNLKAEMARLGITIDQMAEAINKSRAWLENRMNGKCSFPIEVVFSIRNTFFPKMDFQYLFANTAIIPIGGISNDKDGK